MYTHTHNNRKETKSKVFEETLRRYLQERHRVRGCNGTVRCIGKTNHTHTYQICTHTQLNWVHSHIHAVSRCATKNMNRNVINCQLSEKWHNKEL